MLEYFGEFGTEVALFLPYVNYLKKNGLLLDKPSVKSYKGMHPYYFFLNDKEFAEKQQLRAWVHPNSRVSFLPPELLSDDAIFSKMTEKPNYFDPPKLYEHYKQIKFYTKKPIIVIQNKHNSEWGGPPVNFFDVDLVDSMLSNLVDKFSIVYIRCNEYRGPGYSSDENESMSYHLADKEMIKAKYKDVMLYEDVLEKHNGTYDFNTLKCILLANSKVTISTIGGFNFLNAYFPCHHIIYKVDTPPIYNKEYYQNQHNMLCSNPGAITFTTQKANLLSKLADL
jgi:hypothetical protein